MRPVTINLTSDSTNEDLRSENVETGPIPRPRTDSDEIDILSASQLSHDLDQHISQTAGAETEGSELEVTLDSQAEQQDQGGEPRLRSQKTRKRKSSSQKFTSSKRKKTQSLSHASPYSNGAEGSVYATPGEMLDCIEVVPPDAAQAVTANGLTAQVLSGESEPTSPPKRRRGRPRKHPLVATPTQTDVAQNVRIEVVVPRTSHIKEERVEEAGVVDLALQEQELSARGDQALEVDLRMAETATTKATDSVGRIMTDVTDMTANAGSAQPGIIASLQDILDRLKSSNSGDIDLRAVDELCFQIRYQAQANRSV